jgi:hypothetical protein
MENIRKKPTNIYRKKLEKPTKRKVLSVMQRGKKKTFLERFIFVWMKKRNFQACQIFLEHIKWLKADSNC